MLEKFITQMLGIKE